MPIHGGGGLITLTFYWTIPPWAHLTSTSHIVWRSHTFGWVNFLSISIIFVLHPHIHIIEKKGAGSGDNLMGRKKGWQRMGGLSWVRIFPRSFFPDVLLYSYLVSKNPYFSHINFLIQFCDILTTLYFVGSVPAYWL